jgi:hypothetical protein
MPAGSDGCNWNRHHRAQWVDTGKPDVYPIQGEHSPWPARFAVWARLLKWVIVAAQCLSSFSMADVPESAEVTTMCARPRASAPAGRRSWNGGLCVESMGRVHSKRGQTEIWGDLWPSADPSPCAD